MPRFNHPFDPHSMKLVIFDLDGTLIDSRLDLVHSVNAMLRHFSRPELPGDVVASYVGDGAPMLVRRALGDPDDEQFFRKGLSFFWNTIVSTNWITPTCIPEFPKHWSELRRTARSERWRFCRINPLTPHAPSSKPSASHNFLFTFTAAIVSKPKNRTLWA
jgi:phosphoglycolate phosphatase-like HAD superfamily hydrolase